MVDKIDALPPEVRAYFARLGKINGQKLYKERGSEYFKQIAAKRKTFGRHAGTAGGGFGSTSVNTYQHLANKYGVSRQRIHQIITTHGNNLLDKSNYSDENSWREAVVNKYFSNK